MSTVSTHEVTLLADAHNQPDHHVLTDVTSAADY